MPVEAASQRRETLTVAPLLRLAKHFLLKQLVTRFWGMQFPIAQAVPALFDTDLCARQPVSSPPVVR
jgi:hypothetical protein